ncbi:MAG TPA: Clp protease N-terminal domain-containing protein [Acidimicrobiales bacterium]|nr:Clp protease N-terminal domain-containing protein [Acidimicrobiales bacterium]
MHERLADDARRAVVSAREEAEGLGHSEVGTEHLLIGLLSRGSTAAAAALVANGATLVSVRGKVIEARASRTGPLPTGRPADLPLTDRANRALDRAARLSLRLGRDEVECEHILASVLDVEGTAGQVLRGLGVDPESVRRALNSAPPPAQVDRDAKAPPGTAAHQPVQPLCATCGSPLATTLDRVPVTVAGSDPPVRVAVFCCRACGTALGVERD